MSLQTFYNHFILGINDSGHPTVEAQMPFSGLLFRPWSMLFDNFKTFIKLALVFSLLLSLLSWVFGYAYICRYNIYGDIDFYCSRNAWSYLPYFLLKLIAFSYFGMLFCNSLKTTPLSLRQVLTQYRQVLKNTLLLILFLFLVMMPVISFTLLLVRVPNPDWKIEIIYFAFVSLGFLVPFIGIRFLSNFGISFFRAKPIPQWQIWQRSRGNMLKILFALMFILLMGMFVFNSIHLNLKGLPLAEISRLGVGVDFFYNIFTLMFFTLFLNHCLIQYDYLYNGETDD